ncbi:unnamed protein product [Peronospora belbahrii]|uniref:SCP domain-containing protein n=1 Tax=Peronospora belbahrii TaxID=622444 RepID=A0AAU9KS12_9STRA|nr:unnamed protein product [Peronospora belbahrii]
MSRISNFQTGSGGRVMWESNCNFEGHDYRSMRATQYVCGDVCANDASCTHWTWSQYIGGTGWFKTGDRSTKTAEWGTNCGYVIACSSQQGQSAAPNSGLSSSEMTAALQHSQDQANNCKMTHVGSSRSKVGYRIQAQGYRFATAAENVAAGQKTVEQVIISCLAKVLCPIDYAIYWTQDFGRAIE